MKRCGDYWVPDAEELQLEALAAGGWQLERLEAALTHVKQFRVAVDGGAHVGSWTRAMARRFQKVHAFEPDPDTFACLYENVDGLTSVIRHECALGARAGIGCMGDDERFGTRNTGGRNLSPASVDGPAVRVTTLDLEALQDVDFIKMDLEGYEPFAIEGARETLLRCRPVVMIEDKARMAYRYGYLPGEAQRKLESLGMVRLQSIGDDHVFGWP